MREIQRISVTDAVVENIREMIEKGRYSVGDRLPTEAEFCEMMKVSRTCVREALRVLQTLGYVEIHPGKGAFVGNYHNKQQETKWFDGEDVKFYDFMEVRVAIESLSVRLSVERATPAQIKELEEVHKAFVQATENQKTEQMFMLDELFHSKIVRFTNNQLLVGINSQLEKYFRVYRGSSFTNDEVYKNAVEPHERILKCFQNRDTKQAVIEITHHMEITAKDMEIVHRRMEQQAKE